MALHLIGDDIVMSMQITSTNCNADIDPSSLSSTSTTNLQGIARRVSTNSTAQKVNVKGINEVAISNVYTNFEENLEIENFVTSGTWALGTPQIGYFAVAVIGGTEFIGVITDWKVVTQQGEAITLNITINQNADYIG